MSKESNDIFCPLQEVVDTLSHKWSLQIIYHIGKHNIIRYVDLQNKLRYISPKTFCDTLRKLENENIINKKIFNVIPQRVEYSLAKDGIPLYPIVLNLLEWSTQRDNSKIKKCVCYVENEYLKSS